MFCFSRHCGCNSCAPPASLPNRSAWVSISRSLATETWSVGVSLVALMDNSNFSSDCNCDSLSKLKLNVNVMCAPMWCCPFHCCLNCTAFLHSIQFYTIPLKFVTNFDEFIGKTDIDQVQLAYVKYLNCIGIFNERWLDGFPYNPKTGLKLSLSHTHTHTQLLLINCLHSFSLTILSFDWFSDKSQSIKEFSLDKGFRQSSSRCLSRRMPSK